MPPLHSLLSLPCSCVSSPIVLLLRNGRAGGEREGQVSGGCKVTTASTPILLERSGRPRIERDFTPSALSLSHRTPATVAGTRTANIPINQSHPPRPHLICLWPVVRFEAVESPQAHDHDRETLRQHSPAHECLRLDGLTALKGLEARAGWRRERREEAAGKRLG